MGEKKNTSHQLKMKKEQEKIQTENSRLQERLSRAIGNYPRYDLRN
jgi:hypothetical protein